MKIVTKLLEQAEKKPVAWALWNWNSQITEEHLLRQFSEIKDSGFSGIILRPTCTITPDYLSDEFNTFFLSLLSLAEKNDISVMLGDDQFTPPSSDYTQDMINCKNFRAQRLELREQVNLEQGDHYSFTPQKNEQEFVVASVRSAQGKIILEGSQILYNGDTEIKTEWKATKGLWKISRYIVADVRNDSGEFVPNFFNMRYAQSYITKVLEPICEIQGKKVSPNFTGVYCEMPPIVPSKSGLPWDDELFISKYRSRFKRELLLAIPTLFFPTTDADAKYRTHVLNFLQSTLVERFPLICQKWVQNKGLEFWFVGAESDVTDTHSSVSPLFTLSGSSTETVLLFSALNFSLINTDTTDKNTHSLLYP